MTSSSASCSPPRMPAHRRRPFFLFLALLLLILASVVSANGADEDAPLIFEPEADWKEIQPHQQIPGGLEVRMDLSTGKKHARLIIKDRNEEKPVSLSSSSSSALAAVIDEEKKEERRVLQADGTGLVVAVTPEGGAVAVTASGDLKEEEAKGDQEQGEMTATATGAGAGGSLDPASEAIKTILLGLPEPEPELSEAVKDPSITPDQLSALLRKVWQRRQEQLREAFKGAKTEAQQMQGLLQQLLDPNPSSPEVITELLEGLEYHVSSRHNADDFTTMGGIGAVTMLLNDSLALAVVSPPTSASVAAAREGAGRIASRAAWVLGTATKYAAKVQQQALDDGAHIVLMQGLAAATKALEGLSPDASAESTSVDSMVLEIAAKTVYALGSLSRGNHEALVALSRLGFAQEIRRLMRASAALGVRAGDGSSAIAAKSRGLCSKSATLLADLMRETHEARQQQQEESAAIAAADGAEASSSSSVVITSLNAKTKKATAVEGNTAAPRQLASSSSSSSSSSPSSSSSSSHGFVLGHLCGHTQPLMLAAAVAASEGSSGQAAAAAAHDPSSLCRIDRSASSPPSSPSSSRTAELVDAAFIEALGTAKEAFEVACANNAAAVLG